MCITQWVSPTRCIDLTIKRIDICVLKKTEEGEPFHHANTIIWHFTANIKKKIKYKN